MFPGKLRWLVGPLILCTGAAGAARAVETETGNLADLIAELASSEYVLGEPARDDRPYVDPSPVLNKFRHLSASLASGDVDAAAAKAAKVGYEVVRFTDSDTKHDYYVLREDLAKVKTIRGWGSYIFNPSCRVDALIEAPHPKADLHTPEIGGVIFAACGAKGFLLAGAHRAKADVPDLVDSVFHQVHTAWVGPAAQSTAWQIHGFSSIKHAFPRGAKVVASTGDGAVAPEVANLDAVLEQRGLTSYVFNELPPENDANRQLNEGVPGVTFSSLAAAKNEQGRYSRSLGGSFVHVELAEGVRSNMESRTLAGMAIAAVITGAGGSSDQSPDHTADAAKTGDEPVVAAAEAASPAEPEIRVAAKPVSTSRKTEPRLASAAEAGR